MNITRAPDEPFNAYAPIAPGHIQCTCLWLPDETGWTSLLSLADWQKMVAAMRRKYPTPAKRREYLDQSKRMLAYGYEAWLERPEADRQTLPLGVCLAMYLRPDKAGEALRKGIARCRAGSRIVVGVADDGTFGVVLSSGDKQTRIN